MALSIDYYQDSAVRNREIDREMEDRYQQFITPNQMFWREASIDSRFKAGDQRIYSDLYGGNLNRKQFFFNKIMRIANMIGGYQRQNRKSTVIVGNEMSDDDTAGQRSKILFWAQKRANVDHVFSRGFESGPITTGMSLLSLSMNFASDPISGDIDVSNVGYSSFLIDPNFRKHDLTDCQCIWRRTWATKADAKRVYPGLEKMIDSMSPNGIKDNKFPYQAQNFNLALDKLLPIDEYFYLDSRRQLLLHDLESGEVIEWEGEEDDDELKQFLIMYPQITQRWSYVPTVKLAVRLNGRLVYEGPHSLNIDPYPFVPMMGYYDPDMPYSSARTQGVIRGLRDSQFLYNRRKVIELEILESQINSGWKYKIDALVNPNDIYMQNQGKGLALQPSADMTDVEKIQPGEIPASMMALSEGLDKMIMEISGVNEELLGAAQDDKAGILEMVRQGAALVTLQKLFDQADESQKLLGSLFDKAIVKNFKRSKVKRILNEEPTKQFFSYSFGKYDCEITEGVNTATQRQLAFKQAVYLREALQIPIPTDYLLDLATVVDKKKLMESIKEAEQQKNQQEQERQQVEMMLIQAQIDNQQSQAVASTGFGLEHLSRVRKNESETAKMNAQAIEQIEQARLDKVKAMKEISSMELSEIQQLLNLHSMLEQKSNISQQVNELGQANPNYNQGV